MIQCTCTEDQKIKSYNGTNVEKCRMRGKNGRFCMTVSTKFDGIREF